MPQIMKTIQILYTAFILLLATGCSKSSDVSSSTASNGSLTRFITVGNYLYAVDNSSLKTYNLNTPSTPVFKSSTPVGFSIQTILPYQDKLFIGSANAMFIFSITNPEQPKLLSETVYFVRGHDPIVVFDSVAYSTVRNGNGFGGGVLNIFNIKNINQPLLIGRETMSSPYGLGTKDSALYVCDGAAGLKMYNINKPFQPVSRGSLSIPEIIYDIIPQGNALVCYIQGGICLIDISNLFNPVIIAKLKN
jgi:hypothetical protein